MPTKIFRHALLMIYNNLGQALRLSIGPYLLLLLGTTLLVLLFGGLFSASANGAFQSGMTEAEMELMAPGAMTFGSIFIFLPIMLLGLFVGSWVAVSWHRFILLEETTGFIPPISGRPIWPYLGRNIVIWLIITLIALPLFFIASLFAVIPILFPIAMSIAGIAVVGLWFALGMSLPSIAIGKDMTLGDTFAASRPHFKTIFLVALILIVFNFVVGLVVSIIPIIGGLLSLAAQWLFIMLAVSVLTTLHGHLIENRPLMD